MPIALNDLGLTARLQRDYKRAEKLCKQALSIWRNTVGPVQPEYASALANLGLIYQDRHQLAKARNIYLQALRIHEAKLGFNSPQVGNDLINLGNLSYRMNKEAEAQNLLLRALATEKRRGGPPTPITGLAEANLGIIAARQRNTVLAEEMLRNSIESLKVTTTADDPRLIGILKGYAAVLRSNGRFASAETAEVRAMRIRVRAAVRNSRSDNQAQLEARGSRASWGNEE
jgi:Tfp pilus assembly protein PilF